MAKLDWLENNQYAEREANRQKGWFAWFLWAIALVILLIPVRGSALNLYYIHAAEDTPSITGRVIYLNPSPHRGISGGKGGHYDAKVDIEFLGEAYYVTNTGFNFTHGMYERACDSGTVPVYLNRDNPSKSVLSKGVPFMQYFCTGIFALLGLFLIGAGAYFMKCRLKNNSL